MKAIQHSYRGQPYGLLATIGESLLDRLADQGSGAHVGAEPAPIRNPKFPRGGRANSGC